MTTSEAIGLNDISGRPIHEGDDVLIYAQHHETKAVLDDGDGSPPVHLLDATKPKPVADVPLAAGTVIWSEHELAWIVMIHWVCDAWAKAPGRPASLHMGGISYAFEVREPVAS